LYSIWAISIQSVQQGCFLKRLVISWIFFIVCVEREGSKPQAGGDFRSPSEKVKDKNVPGGGGDAHVKRRGARRSF